MEIEYIAQDLAKLFVRTNDKVKAAIAIIDRINSLTFENGRPLDNADKELILKLIGEFLSGSRLFKYRDGGVIIAPKAHDNAAYLDLIEYILSQVRK